MNILGLRFAFSVFFRGSWETVHESSMISDLACCLTSQQDTSTVFFLSTTPVLITNQPVDSGTNHQRVTIFFGLLFGRCCEKSQKPMLSRNPSLAVQALGVFEASVTMKHYQLLQPNWEHPKQPDSIIPSNNNQKKSNLDPSIRMLLDVTINFLPNSVESNLRFFVQTAFAA